MCVVSSTGLQFRPWKSESVLWNIHHFFFSVQFFSTEEIYILRWLWEGNVRERITFQTRHTPVNIRTEIKASPLPTAVHPQQIWQSAPIVWPWPITDNGSPPEPPPQRPNWSCTQGCGLRSEDSCGMLMNTHDMTCQLSCSVTASNRLGAMWSFSFSSASPFKNVPVRSPRVWIWSYHVLYLHESS